MYGKIEIDGIKTSKSFNWEYLPGKRIIKQGIPCQRLCSRIRMGNFLDFEFSFKHDILWQGKLCNVKFYYGDSGGYFSPTSPLVYKGRGIFLNA